MVWQFYLPQTVVQVLVPDFFALMRVKMSLYAIYIEYFSAQSQKGLTGYCYWLLFKIYR